MDSSEKSNFHLQKIKDYIKNHPETKHLQIKDEDVIIVFNYLNKKDKPNPFGYKLVLKEQPYLHVVWQETAKTKQIDWKNNLQQKNFLFNQEINLTGIDIKNIKSMSKIQKIIFNYMRDIVEKYNSFDINIKQNKGLYIYGPFNSGKTFMLKILAKMLLINNIPFLFIVMSDLVRQFKFLWTHDIIEDKINHLKKIPFLILDDFGLENMNAFFRDDIFIPLLNYRYEYNLPVFFSSVLHQNDLKETLQLNVDLINATKSAKIINLIQKSTLLYDFSDNISKNKLL
ncbi:ATP-binding protein ['Opuntia sp.' phytoplasma]|uniref:ATP-binding protein n=1 Tax=Candidatus Phytoplasma asiaticum TaxID=2763338 RepID=A0AAX3B8R9_9MOLU|nr:MULTISPECIES: ATP-binding protein [Phytoplasma]MDO8054099.1 ATP-binding protein ['Opuntia sp.' phytoplasma]MDO8057963.1 ATP-binding protein ['Opuntia sp.' phytoplasma]UQV27081.1 ATP-binding protein ['Parthenium hysterophorus' phyllody phytoplasma]